MTLIRINDNICWMCGRQRNDMTQHHGIPQHLKPVHNIEMPICKPCHDKINADDLGNMYAYVFKLCRTADQIKSSTFRLQGEITKYINKGDNNDTRNEVPKVQK